MIIKRNFDYYGANRPLHIYLPDTYDQTDERYPVMYFFDGHNLFYDSDATYGKSWGLKTFLDSWEKEMIVVGMECSHVGNERLEEYLPYPATTTAFGPLAVKGNETLDWIVNQVKPVIDREYRTYPHRQCTGIAGSSMGGLMSIRGVIHYNQVFSKAACVSPSVNMCYAQLYAQLRDTPIDPDTRVYLSWGEVEARDRRTLARMTQQNLALCSLLMARQARVLPFLQEEGRHCEEDWSRQADEFMRFLWLE